MVFDTGEKKAEWEEAFSKAKEKLEASETLFIFLTGANYILQSKTVLR